MRKEIELNGLVQRHAARQGRALSNAIGSVAPGSSLRLYHSFETSTALEKLGHIININTWSRQGQVLDGGRSRLAASAFPPDSSTKALQR